MSKSDSIVKEESIIYNQNAVSFDLLKRIVVTRVFYLINDVTLESPKPEEEGQLSV